MQSIAQRFTLIFLTNLGDVKFDSGFGTTFWGDALRGATQNLGQVTVAVHRAILDAMVQMQDEDADTDTYGSMLDDDRIKDATLLSYQLERTTGTLRLSIGLTNMAGASYTYVLPVQAVRI
jgi:hypothetical protein